MRTKLIAGLLAAAGVAGVVATAQDHPRGEEATRPKPAAAVEGQGIAGERSAAAAPTLDMLPVAAKFVESIASGIPGLRRDEPGTHVQGGPDGGFSSEFLQMAWIVDDIAEAEAFFENKLGTCQFVHLDDAPAGPNSMYRGQPGQWVADIYLGQWGDIQIELIHPEAGPSIFDEWLDAHGNGLQHFAVTVENFDDARTYLEANGFPLVQYFEPLASKVGYFDLGPALGVHLEIIELNLAGEALFDLVKSCVLPV